MRDSHRDTLRQLANWHFADWFQRWAYSETPISKVMRDAYLRLEERYSP
jgi:hypothetical protein